MSAPPQKKILKGLDELLVTSYNKGLFSASSVAFFCEDFDSGNHFHVYCGTTDAFKRVKTDKNSLFDLASLTKPLVTLLCILTLIENKELSWSDSVDTFFPGCSAESGKDLDIYHLLCHASGLPAHKMYWPELETMPFHKRRLWMVSKIINEERPYKKGAEHIYSDLGYMLLGFIVEEKSGQNMADFWKKTIAKPLGIDKKLFFPLLSPTREHCFVATSLEDKIVPGVVHDENCRALGGVSGHAGLFGTPSGVLTLCQELLFSLNNKKNHLPFSSQTLNMACLRDGDSDWTAGFSMPSRQGSSSGNYFSEQSIGHLGFTGTSFWIDPVKKLVVVLLTNRVIRGEKNEGIKQLRPLIHDYIAEQLGFKRPPS